MRQQPIKIAIASLGDPASLTTWSGIPFHIIENLKIRGHHVIPIWIKTPAEPWYYDWLRRIHHRFNGQWFLAAVEPKILRKIGRQLEAALLDNTPDVLISIHGDLLSYSSNTVPSVIIHDTTFEGLLDYYPAFSNLSSRSRRMGNVMYNSALSNCTAAVFSAGWASASAVEHYGTRAEKIHTIPFGANLLPVPSDEQVKKWILERSSATQVQFLFLGIDWERKGGPDAVRTVKKLKSLGIDCTLNIVGCMPDIPEEDASLCTFHGFLDKSIPADAEKLQKLMAESSALLLPSLAECYGCVYCEANAYGMPAIGRDTGGVSEAIKDGKNGIMMASDETPEMLAERWLGILNTPGAYQAMSRRSRTEYEERLNYEQFVIRLESDVFNRILSN